MINHPKMADLRRVELNQRLWLLTVISSLLISSCNSLGTMHGLARLQERQRRAVATGTPVSPPYNAQARYAYPTSGANTLQPASSSPYMSQSYPQQPPASYAAPQQSAASYAAPQQSAAPYAVPRQAGMYPTYPTQQAYPPQTSAAATSSYNPGYNAASLYRSPSQYNTNGYAVPSGAAAQPNYGQAVPSAYGTSSYPAGAYPTQPMQYPAAAASPQQARYNFNGFNPYAANTGYNNYPAQQGRAAAVLPQVTTPSPNQFELAEFCKKPDREPRCTKNSFGMCDFQDNYPSEVASEFFGYWKSRINAMATDYDYSNSDQYDTGFGTQQNKLIDFVHEIFEDNEFGGLPGVPPQRKGLCVEVSDTSQPGWARTSRNRYMVIMNSNNVKQSVRAGICRNMGKDCQTVPRCYKSECRQRYRYDTLLVFDPCNPSKPPMLELFKIPDGCECFVLQDEPDISLNLASPALPKIAQQTTKTNTKGRTSDFATAALNKANNEAALAGTPTATTTTTKATTTTPTTTTTSPTTTTTTTTTTSTTPSSSTTSTNNLAPADGLKAL